MPHTDPAKHRESSRRWRLANPEKEKQRIKKWRLANPENIKKWRLANPEKIKQSQRRRELKRYGWTPERVAQARIEQGDKCAICRETFTTTPCADHKHVTPPEPRALLCINCNTMIGQAQENPKILRAAADFLEAWS